MVHAAITLWFAITTLLGPWVCCCSLANPAHPTVTYGQTAPTSKPTKSCCHQEAPPSGENGKPEPGKPSKCPCEHPKPVVSLAATGTATADLAAQLNLLDVLCVWLLASFTFDSPAVASASAYTSPPFAKLAGRDMLAAYSLLRC